jgi:hypothetical protein
LRIAQLFVVSLVASQLVACAESREAFRATLARRTVYIERNMLETVPCISDGIRTTFGAESVSRPSYGKPQLTTREAVKHELTVKLTPETADVPASETRTVVYEIFDGGRNRTGIRYGVEVPGAPDASRDDWWAQALAPLTACGATAKN